MKKRILAAVLTAVMIVVLLPQTALGVSSSKANGKTPAVTETVRGFSAYTATAGSIFLHWAPLDEAEGVLIYRADSAKGPFKQIAKVKYDPEKGPAYKDQKVTPGKTYYYKARPYATSKGKVIKGKLTKVSSKKAKYYNPTTASVTVMQTGEKEVVFHIVMKPWSFDTEFFCPGTGKNPELDKAGLTQTWIKGSAMETRRTKVQIIGLSADGERYQEWGSLTVPSGKDVYLKAAAGEAIELGTETRLAWSVPCIYNGKYNVISGYDENMTSGVMTAV